MKLRFVKSFIKNNFKFYLSLIICTAICFSSFVTFNFLQSSLDNGLNSYLKNYNYYDGLVQPYFGSFTNEEVFNIKNIKEIDKINIAYITDQKLFKDKDYRYIRLIGADLKDINYYTLDEISDGDILLSAEFASLNNLKVGDYVDVNLNNKKVKLKIKKLINSPELLGASRGVSYSLEQSSLGFAYIDINILKKYVDIDGYNTVTYYLKDNKDSKIVSKKIKNMFNNKQIYFEENDNLIAKTNIKNDLEVLKPVASILPLLIYIIGLVISILFIRQFIETKLKDIGILKSNGVSNSYILSIFILYSLSISIIGSILGIILSIIQSRIYTNFYTDSIFLPKFNIIGNYTIVLLAILISIIINVLAIIFNINSFRKINVVDIINENLTTKKKKVNLFKNKMISIKPFLASIFNKPFRFLFMTINMIFVVIIVSASICVKKSKDNSILYIYNKKINYDYIIHYHSYSKLNNNYDNSYKETNILINDDYYEKLYVLNNTKYIKIYDEQDKELKLNKGIIISNKLAKTLNVKIGDYVIINNQKVLIDGISKEIMDYKSYMSFDTYNMLFNDKTCNAYFIKGDIDKYNTNNEEIYYISNTKLLKKDLINKFEYISNYIIIIILISSLISIIVIFNMSVIYYRERFKEHKILRTIGYSSKKIIIYSLIEIIIQCIISLFIGIPVGYLLSSYTITQINNDYITLYSYFKDTPIILISIFIFLVSTVGRIISSKNQIKLVDDN